MLLYQIILFFIFILDNYATLDNVEINVAILSFDSTITVNFYLFVGILVSIYTAVILIGISVLESGLSDPSLQKLNKFVRLLFIFGLMFIPIAYYLQFLNNFSIIIEIVIFAVYLLEGLFEIGVDSE